jgi:hypothetical protein
MLKLHAGVSKKVGLPGFSSASASCTIETELDSSLLQDHEGFQVVVQRVYRSCETAIEDQIARLTSGEPNEPSRPQQQEVVEVRTSRAITGASVNRIPATQLATPPRPRPATASQVRAIRAICIRRGIDLTTLLRERHGLSSADALGIKEASILIDQLKGESEATSVSKDNGPCVTGGAR